ncbi:hypothetical protein PX122_12910 [Pseudomonas aeruginosa]|uniref:DUF6932 family protein n=2 Tax=Pseudomonas aeruginosa TaxID=287 RepID=UPI001E341B1E|nr:hypothetical protein [Pseudomonas aeruginosa]UGR44427.1 hypothetical protein LSP20_28450 [Pseudomonas aeruginosa]HBN9211657.1 hypothetical protein [Pseudomonas aeruginosa]HBO3124996.1 hypothetical protein [Pseudomonas aeruginosa]HEC0172370.1 hypothetical protein [Pseudomonas aeruginosa]HEC0387169.1 hypothetical protein [Pseudomonas aeruginosa]
MMDQPKIDFAPLIPESGLHLHTLSSLKELAVLPFPESARREALFNALAVYLELLESTGLMAFIWVDGSFMCAKPEPDDIDLVVVYDAERVDSLSESALEVVNELLNTNRTKARFNLHVFRAASDDSEGLDFWFQKFGTQRDEVTPKGLAELRINHD